MHSPEVVDVKVEEPKSSHLKAVVVKLSRIFSTLRTVSEKGLEPEHTRSGKAKTEYNDSQGRVAMVTRRFPNDYSSTVCDRCSRAIYVGELMQGTKVGSGPWTDKRCYPDCETALALRRRIASGSAPAACPPPPPKTVTFRVNSVKKLVECVECGKAFRVGDQMAAEVHHEVGAEKWQNKRCFPSCKGRKAGGGVGGTSKMAGTRATTSATDAARSAPVLTPGRRCNICQRTLQAGESFLSLPTKAVCNPCLRTLIGPVSPSTPATPSERKLTGSSSTASPGATIPTTRATPTIPSTHTQPGAAPLAAGLAGLMSAAAPAAPSKRKPPSTNFTPTSGAVIPSTRGTPTSPNQYAPQGFARSPISVAPAGWLISTRPLGPTPTQNIVAITALLEMQNFVRGWPPPPTLQAAAAAAAAANSPRPLTNAGPAGSRGCVGSSTRPRSGESDTLRQSTPSLPVSRFDINRPCASVAAAATTTNWAVSRNRVAAARNRAVPAVPAASAASARNRASQSREDDGVECIGDVGIEEQIKRRMATSVVVNLADSEEWTSALSPSTNASHPPAKKKMKLGKEKINTRRSDGSGGGSCRNGVVDLT